MMKNAFYFTSKSLFDLKIFKFLSWLFGHLAKRLDKKIELISKFYNITAWLTNNCNTHIAQYLEKYLSQLIECTWEIFFLKYHTQNVMEKLVPDPFLKD